MKDIIWLSPSLAAGAVAARLVVFFKRRPQCSRVKNSSRPHRLMLGAAWLGARGRNREGRHRPIQRTGGRSGRERVVDGHRARDERRRWH